VPLIRHFLEDPVNWPVVGRKPDARRNSFMALLLSVDRVGGDEFAVIPLDRVCDVSRHARGYSGPACPLCSVMRLLGRLHGEGLIEIKKVVGDSDGEGHYLVAQRIVIEPAPGLEKYREKIRRLALPPVLMATRKSQKKMSSDPEATWVRLSAIPVDSWSRLTFELGQDSFKANGVVGYPADLGLAQHEWSLLCDIAKAGGSYSPKLLGDVEMQFRKTFNRLNEVLKSTFPQIAGDPLQRTGTGTYQANMKLRILGRPIDEVW
jgi:hypothetical protein